MNKNNNHNEMSKNEVLNINDWELLNQNEAFKQEQFVQIQERYNLCETDALKKIDTIKKMLKIIAKEQYSKKEIKETQFRETNEAVLDKSLILSELEIKKRVKDSRINAESNNKENQISETKSKKTNKNAAKNKGPTKNDPNSQNNKDEAQVNKIENKNQNNKTTKTKNSDGKPTEEKNNISKKDTDLDDNQDIVITEHPKKIVLIKKSLDFLVQVYKEIDNISIDEDDKTKNTNIDNKKSKKKTSVPKINKEKVFNNKFIPDLGYPEYDPKCSKNAEAEPSDKTTKTEEKVIYKMNDTEKDSKVHTIKTEKKNQDKLCKFFLLLFLEITSKRNNWSLIYI